MCFGRDPLSLIVIKKHNQMVESEASFFCNMFLIHSFKRNNIHIVTKEQWKRSPTETPTKGSEWLYTASKTFFTSLCFLFASTTAIAVILIISSTVAPRCRTCTGFRIPNKTGPITVASPILAISL